MKVTLSAAVLGCLVAPAFSLSYLESLNTASATLAPPGGAAGASAGAGASYLDALASPASAAPSGSGMTSYLDALPKNTASVGGGSGLSSYMDNLSGGAAVAAAAPAASAPPASSGSSYSPESFSAPIVAGGNYLEAITAASASGAPTGAGMTTYLDALPRASVPMGGAGIPSYSNSLPVTNTVSGFGVPTYTDNLSGGIASSSKSYSPFSTDGTPKKAAGGFGLGQITLGLENIGNLLDQLRGNGGSIKLSGKINKVSFD